MIVNCVLDSLYCANCTELPVNCDWFTSFLFYPFSETWVSIVLSSVQVLFSAWQCGALASDYFKDKLTKITDQLNQYENQEMAPPGWKTVWDRYGPLYLLLLQQQEQLHPFKLSQDQKTLYGTAAHRQCCYVI